MTTQLAPDRFALPPPLELDLVDAGRVTGWIVGNAVGFRGFGNKAEATHAAWVAHRTLARRLARTHATRAVPIDIEPLALHQVGDKAIILASGRPIAHLIRPGPASRSGVDSFGFELSIPTPTSELEARALAHLMYRTLRKSGVRWAMWRPEAPRVTKVSTARTSVDTATAATESIDARTSDANHRPRAARNPAVPTWRGSTGLTRVVLTGLSLAAAAVLAFGVAPFVAVSLTAVLLAGVGAGGVVLLRSRRLR